MENGNTVELYIERKKDRGLVGNIYKGKVLRVLPGMQAAFVDVGLDKAAFLYVSDIYTPEGDMTHFMKEPEDDHLDEDDTKQNEAAEFEPGGSGNQDKERHAGSVRQRPIEDLLSEGQEILVQVAKDPIGTKGCRITTNISLAGRHLVYMPFIDHIGISRRITGDQERHRLRDLVSKLKPEGGGFIVRTVAEGLNEKKLKADMTLLINIWKQVTTQAEKLRAPTILHYDLNLSFRATRDLLTADVDKLIIDDPDEFDNIHHFIKNYMPGFRQNVELYSGDEPIFDYFSVEMDLNRALGRKVWLKSGGYIIIDQAEALTAIDVNTGRYVGKRNLEETILKTNLEAVREIAYQLRLRNIGGIIIIDFIDMEREVNRERIFNALQEALVEDRAKTNILKISDFGLVEMTRKRVRESLGRTLCEPCFYCDGKGYLKSKTTICYEIFREIEREIKNLHTPVIHVNCHPEIADLLYEEEGETIAALEKQYKKTLVIRGLVYFHIEQYEVIEKPGSGHSSSGKRSQSHKNASK